jgi:hypothetical protein
MLYSESLGDGQNELRKALLELMQKGSRHPLDTRLSSAVSAHITNTMPLHEVIQILVDIPVIGEEKELLDTRLFALRAIVDDDIDVLCEVTFMDSLDERFRSISGELPEAEDWENAAIANLMAGRAANYAGDEKMISETLVSIQFHSITPKIGETHFPQVIAAAIHWPIGMRNGVVWEIAGQRDPKFDK